MSSPPSPEPSRTFSSKLRRGAYLLFGVLALAASVATALSSRSLAKRGLHADAVVVNLPYGGNHPEMQFTTAAGETVMYSPGSPFVERQLGDKIEVIYDPAAPAYTVEDASTSLWSTPIALFVGGVIAVFVALRRRQRVG